MRGDIKPLGNELVIEGDKKWTLDGRGMPFMCPSWQDVAWKTKVSLSGGKRDGKRDGVLEVSFEDAYFNREFPAQLRERLKDAPFGGGAVSVNRDTGTFVVDTPRTAGGFTEGGMIETKLFVAAVGGAPASVWASSLDGKPLDRSSRILVAHITDVQNSGITYSERARRTLLSWGGLPHIAEAGKAIIALNSDTPDKLAVWRLANDGTRVAKVDASVVDGGRLVFHANTAHDKEAATLYYEMVRE